LLPTPAVAPVDASSIDVDPETGHLVLCACGASTLPQPEFWVWNGTSWAAFSTAPLPVASGTEITDGSQLLMFGPPKSSSPSGEPPVDVWALSARSTWSQLDQTS
jgi:hypothetical protein